MPPTIELYSNSCASFASLWMKTQLGITWASLVEPDSLIRSLSTAEFHCGATIFDACARFPWTSCLREQPHSEGEPEWQSIGACRIGRGALGRLSAALPPAARSRPLRPPVWPLRPTTRKRALRSKRTRRRRRGRHDLHNPAPGLRVVQTSVTQFFNDDTPINEALDDSPLGDGYHAVFGTQGNLEFEPDDDGKTVLLQGRHR